MEIEVNELTTAEFGSAGGSRGTWNDTGILEFAKELSKDYPNKVIGLALESVEKDGRTIEGFYNKFYNGANKIKYIGYYCRKRLSDAFNTLGITADVKQTKNQLLVQLRGQAEETETEEKEESEEVDEDE